MIQSLTRTCRRHKQCKGWIQCSRTCPPHTTDNPIQMPAQSKSSTCQPDKKCMTMLQPRKSTRRQHMQSTTSPQTAHTFQHHRTNTPMPKLQRIQQSVCLPNTCRTTMQQKQPRTFQLRTQSMCLTSLLPSEQSSSLGYTPCKCLTTSLPSLQSTYRSHTTSTTMLQ
jgi:hypothetical protein